MHLFKNPGPKAPHTFGDERSPMKKIDIKYLAALAVLVAFMAYGIALIPKSDEKWLHPDMTYSVVESADGLLVCQSESFDLWPFNNKATAVSVVKAENFPNLSLGKKFKVNEPLNPRSPYASEYVIVLN